MASSPTRGRDSWSDASAGLRVARVVLILTGSLAGFAAALWSYMLTPSLWLAGFGFVMSYYLIARGGVSAIGRPRKLERLVFYALLPAIGAAILGLVVLAGGPLWLAVALGVIAGSLGQNFIGRLLIPAIAVEEGATSLVQRWLRPETWGTPGPDDFVPPWMRRNDRAE